MKKDDERPLYSNGNNTPITDTPITDTPATRFLAALDLMELGFELKRQNLKREMASASDAEIDEKLQRWINET